MTTTTETLTDAMREHGIDIRIQSGPTLTRSEDGWEHNAYRFELTINDEMILSNAPYMAGTGIKETTAADIFGSVLMDSQSVAGFDDWADWADDLGFVTDAKTAKKAQTDFNTINARRTLMVERLGDEAVEALEEIASEL